MLLVADSVTGVDAAQANGRADVTGKDLLDLFTLVGVHLQETANALGASGTRIQDAVARLQRSGVHTNEHQLTDERISHDLESEAGERLTVIRLANYFFHFLVRVTTFNRRYVKRRGQEI